MMPLYLRESRFEFSTKGKEDARIACGTLEDGSALVMITSSPSLMEVRIVSSTYNCSVTNVTVEKLGEIYSGKVTYTVGELNDLELKNLVG